MARPTKRTPEIEATVLAALSDRAKPSTLLAACGRAGITDETWRSWCKVDPELRERWRIALACGADALEQRVLDPSIGNAEANVLRHRLGCLNPDEWGERQVRIDGGKMTVADLMAEDAQRDGG